jgi:hypothetical protein
VGKLAITVVAIALPDCLNPSLISAELLVATGPRPRRRVVAFTVAAWGVTFAVGLAMALGLGDLILSLIPKPSATVKYALITAAGAVLLIGAIGIWIRRSALVGSEPASGHHELHGSPAVIGAAVAGVELLTAFPYFAVIALIVGSGVSNAGKVSLVGLYCLVYALPLIVIAAAFVVMGDRAGSKLQPVGDWLASRWPVIVAPLTAIIGVGVLAFGVVHLTRS